MISYEVARELRDAEFPQEDHFFYWWEETDPPSWWNIYALEKQQPNWKKTCAAPTLEKLIEYCDGALQNLTNCGSFWQTNFIDGMAGETAGHTPDDAVARLAIKILKG